MLLLKRICYAASLLWRESPAGGRIGLRLAWALAVIVRDT